MALVVFLRGVNVGGHRTFRPSILARELADYDVVNVGAAGTFVVRKPGSPARFRALLLRRLPFVAEIMICDGRDVGRLASDNPFGKVAAAPDIVRFVSVLPKAGRLRTALPILALGRGPGTSEGQGLLASNHWLGAQAIEHCLRTGLLLGRPWAHG